jgi:hypothetical protein
VLQCEALEIGMQTEKNESLGKIDISFVIIACKRVDL